MIRRSSIAAFVLLPAFLYASESFTLGEVQIVDEVQSVSEFETSVDAYTIAQKNAQNIAQAADTISGVSLSKLGGRNETTLSIRGFDSRRVAVYIDGVPIYVPYDGNIDYSRFLSADISKIDISKGFSSVAYGANTLGGVVNVVTKKPTKAYEGTISSQLNFDDNLAYAAHQSGANFGARFDAAYMQISATKIQRDHSNLPASYAPTAIQNEGERIASKNDELQVTMKVGYELENGEIALGYVNIDSSKEQPPVTDTTYSKAKYWDWPTWDKESVYLLGSHTLGNGKVKFNLYYDSFKNSLNSYDDTTYSTMIKNYAFKSRYDDKTYGSRISYDFSLDKHALNLSFNIKKDEHKGYDIDKVSDEETLSEKIDDTTYSYAIEDRYTLNDSFEIVAGVSYDKSEPGSVSDSTIAELNSQSAINPQAALVYKIDSENQLIASVARKSYFASMKERYSYRLGYGVPNPDLDAEKALHYDLTYKAKIANVLLESSIYVSKVDDKIESVYYDTQSGKDRFKNQNVGTFFHRGFELDLKYLQEFYELGGNYSYVKIDTGDADIKPLGIPAQQLHLYGQYDFSSKWSAFAAMNGRKGSYTQGSATNSYYENPAFMTADAKLIFHPLLTLDIEVGVKNIADALYYYDMGFPEIGREYFAKLSYNF
ncbi:MAG: TonB-dependent receptor [Sulfurimonas sp.]|nr:TonB-dependent receptor [Sulfurimonas sp.]MDD5202841.1 TonB-dependent receptor [Sulfurimonas sp.]